MNNNSAITYGDVKSFFNKILGRNEYLHVQTDETLIDTRSRGMLFLPNSFYNLIQTRSVKRMSRILQNGTKIYEYPSMFHTRLEHSKGTYNRTLELMYTLYKDPKIVNLIEEKGYNKYVVTELIRALLHDIGHGPFSHTLETVCSLPKGFHEDIGLRLIEEYPELRDALNDIYPGLPELYKETIERNFLGLNMIFEGQADLDRGDFLPRDSFFAHKNSLENSDEQSPLKDFLIHNIGKKPEEIDLDEYVLFDDVEYLKGVIDISKNTKDPILKKLALMSLPPQESALGFYYGLMVSEEQVDENGNRMYTNKSDEEFIEDLCSLPDSKKEYKENCITLNHPASKEVEEIISKLKDLLKIETEDLESLGIISWKNRDISYKAIPGREIYIKDKTGKIFEYSKHPERRKPIFDETTYGFCLLTPLLEANGYSEKQINLAKSIV